ncbi:MAG: RagB/SusD family nutrient uptake outer membrane protein [Tannerellaceae bacterium]|jgi:tetratricopeptide (TPR) repeat protein|nr:RagB/SusD family nutrient uptake outer membrane protein [Tannerellaceae bacterium]
MRKTILYLSFIIAISSTNSCSSFLEENPVDRLVTGNFYNTQKDAEAAVNAAYGQLENIYNRLMYNMAELPTDMMKNGLGMPNAYLQDLEFMRYNSENTFVQSMWNSCYVGIMKTNTAINNIPIITMDMDFQARLIGEVRLLRALFYFNLVRFYGGVPLVTKLESLNDALGKRASKGQIYEFIIQDLQEAEKVLPFRSGYDSANEGRVTKGTAKILLGKVYLTMGDFTAAKEKLAEVIENETAYGYGLHKDYAANWNTETEAGIEAVLYIEYKKAPLQHNNAMDNAGPKYSVPGGSIGVNGSNEADIPTQELYDSYDERDKRRHANVRYTFYSMIEKDYVQSRIPLFGKYWIDGVSATNQCDINMHIIRYADALLMYAEALNEVGESAKAHEVLNRVRERAFGDDSGNFNDLSKEQFRLEILNERRLEFPHEGHRWFDLVRTGTFIERMKAHGTYEAGVAESNKVDIANNIKDYMILMPIPQREIDLNPELEQNPGWN